MGRQHWVRLRFCLYLEGVSACLSRCAAVRENTHPLQVIALIWINFLLLFGRKNIGMCVLPQLYFHYFVAILENWCTSWLSPIVCKWSEDQKAPNSSMQFCTAITWHSCHTEPHHKHTPLTHNTPTRGKDSRTEVLRSRLPQLKEPLLLPTSLFKLSQEAGQINYPGRPHTAHG